MKDNHRKPDSDNDTVGKLIGYAAPRDAVPDLVQRRVRRQVEQSWQQATSARRRRRRVPLAMAASVIAVAALLLIVLPRQADVTAPAIGQLAKLQGSPRINNVRITDGALQLREGDVITTGATDRIAIALSSGASVRLDRHSQLSIASLQRFSLEAGAVYVDSGVQPDDTAGSGMVITTRFGDARDIGTQFEVRLADDLMAVSVREGRVDLTRGSQQHTARAGSGLIVGPQGSVNSVDVLISDQRWRWAQGMAPDYHLEGSSLFDYLSWVARETGRELVFTDDQVRATAQNNRLHGNIDNISPEASLSAVLPSSGLSDRIVVSPVRISVTR